MKKHLLNLPNSELTETIIKVFEDISYTPKNFTPIKCVQPRNIPNQTLYTDNNVGLGLALWDIHCRYNEFGNYNVVKFLKDSRKNEDFKKLLTSLPTFFAYEHTGSLIYPSNGFMGWHTN